MTHTAPPVPTSLYRYFDEHGVLLYIGITSRGAARNVEHNKAKEWWGYVGSQTVEHFLTRAEALGAERRAISRCRPPYNVQHNPNHVEARESYEMLRALRANAPKVNQPAEGKFVRHVSLVPVDFMGDPGELVLRSRVEDYGLIQHVHSAQYPVALTLHGSGKVHNPTASVQVQGPVVVVSIVRNKLIRRQPLIAAEMVLKRMCQKPVRDVVSSLALNDVNKGRF